MARAGPSAVVVAEPPPAGDWRERAAAHGGRQLDGQAGTLVLEFPAVLPALSWATELQLGGAGVAVGIAAADEPEAAAAQLCARAERGQVLVSRNVHAAAAGRSAHALRQLDGDGWELVWRAQEPRTRVRLCGPLALEIDGRDVGPDVPRGQVEALLRYLLANRERGADRDELIDVLWPERPPKDPQADLRPILSRLRRAVAPAALAGRERLRLVLPEPVWVDVEAAARAIGAARTAARSGVWRGVRAQAEAVLALLRPGFLPDDRAEWAEARRRSLEEVELEALEWVARSSIELGGADLGDAERASRELIARARYRETGYRFLMTALAAGGNVAEALRVYEDLRVLLREELGVAPAVDVQELHRRLLFAEPGGRVADAGDAAPEPPRRIALPGPLAPGKRAPFVGREAELAVLRAAWQDARSGTRRLVLVAGEPGIGKTRLTTELALEANEDGTVLYASCQEEALLSYQPFVEVIRHYSRSAGLDWTRLPLGPGARELARLVPELAVAPSAGPTASAGDADTDRYLLFEAISLFFAEASRGVPVLLVLDDLHWADRATLHLLRFLVRAPYRTPLLIVATYRAGEVGADHPLAEFVADLRRDRLVERLSLDGLDEDDVAALIASHAGHEAWSGLVETVHERTEGNPFFVEELMRHLIETGVLFERDGRWASARTLDEIGVPEGVKEVLTSRLGRLSEPCRTALTDAAVLGREFSFEILRSMADLDEDALIAALEEAVEAQLVVEVQGRAAPAYAFTHALVREALYGGLGGPRRQRLHGRAARAIEATEPEPQIAALAVHLRLAGPAGDPARAVDYSLRAGQAARELSAWDEAAAHWDGALAIIARAGGQERECAQLLVALAELMMVVGDLGRQIAYLERALRLYEQLGDEERAAQVHSRLGMAHSQIDSIYADHLDIRRGFRHFQAARRVLGEGPARRARGHLEVGVSTAFTYGLRIPDGIEAAVRAMEIGEQLGDESLWAGAAEVYAWHSIVAGDFGAGTAALDRAFEIADERRSPFLAWMALNIRGQLTWGLGAPDEAGAFFERALRLPYFGKTGYRQQTVDGLGRCHASRGAADQARRLLSDARPTWITHSLKPLLDLWDGRWDEVESLAAQVLETSRRTANRWDEWASYHLAARARYLRGDLEPARELLERALAIVVDGGAPYFELWVAPDLARVLAEGGRIEQARGQVDRCRAIVGGSEEWRGRAGHATLAEAVVLALEGRMDAAERAFAAAREILRRYRLPADEADALHQWGRALAGAGAEREAAARRFDEATELYRTYGAGAAWLDRVERDRRRLRASPTGKLTGSPAEEAGRIRT